MPSAFLFRSLLEASVPADGQRDEPRDEDPAPTLFHLQDFNLVVLQLVTLPNLVLACLPFLPAEVFHSEPPENDAARTKRHRPNDIEAILPDLDKPGELTTTPILIAAFRDLLNEHHIELRFTHGHWSGLAQQVEEAAEGRYHLIMTAETIYAEDSVSDLLSVLRSSWGATIPSDDQITPFSDIDEGLGSMQLREDWDIKPVASQDETVILVAAKVRERPM